MQIFTWITGFFTDFLKNFRKKKGFGRIITYYNYSRINKKAEKREKSQADKVIAERRGVYAV